VAQKFEAHWLFEVQAVARPGSTSRYPLSPALVTAAAPGALTATR
jgi:hypothetical protein